MSNPLQDENSITQQYLQLLSNIQTTDIHNTNTDKLDDLLTQTEILFSQIQKPCILKLDARIIQEAVSLTSERLESSIRNFKLNTSTLLTMNVNNLEKYYKRAIKHFYGVYFKQNIELLNVEKIKRNMQPRNVLQECEIKKPTFLVNKENDNIEIVDKIVKLVMKMGRIEYFRLVVDVGSFSRTVENMFYLAFAVRMRMVSVRMEDGVVSVVVCGDGGGDEEVEAHMIVDLDYEEYSGIKVKLNLEKSLIE